MSNAEEIANADPRIKAKLQEMKANKNSSKTDELQKDLSKLQREVRNIFFSAKFDLVELGPIHCGFQGVEDGPI